MSPSHSTVSTQLPFRDPFILLEEMQASESERNQLQRELLVEEVKQLSNTLAHLELSVNQLQEEHQTNPEQVYKEAIDVRPA